MSCDNEIAPPTSEKEIVENISKTWSCEMIEDGGFEQTFESIISSDASDETKIFISNFHKSGESVYAYVSKDLMITIPEQQIDNQIIKGTAEISNDYTRISWVYTINTEDEIINVTGISTSGGEI